MVCLFYYILKHRSASWVLFCKYLKFIIVSNREQRKLAYLTLLVFFNYLTTPWIKNNTFHHVIFCLFYLLYSPFCYSSMYYRSWGIISLTIAYIWQLYTLWILVQLHEAVPGKRYNRYVELAQAAFGENAYTTLQVLCPINFVIIMYNM